MVEAAPRYDRRILEAVRALDDRSESMAEISRRVGVAAAQLGLPKPSYVHLRRYIVEHREQEDYERARREEIRRIFFDVYLDVTHGKVVDAYEVADRIREAGK
jgi:23S rRNA maturation-related 3'-5' exoribonuclease YhaM